MTKMKTPKASPSAPTSKAPRVLSRRLFLKGAGGVVVGLPLLESLYAPGVHARDAVQTDPFAIFIRTPNGVATYRTSQDEIGSEPERFWPTELGALSTNTVNGRALDELSTNLDKLLVLRRVNGENFSYGDGHARGAIQCLTSRGPLAGTSGGQSEGSGISLDMLLAEQLNPAGTDSLYLYAGNAGGWLGGACISYRGSGVRHAAERNPYNAFQNLFGGAPPGDTGAARQSRRRTAINDLVRGQMTTLMGNSRLSAADRSRLQDHFDAIRDVEVAVTCSRDQAEEALIQTGSDTYNNLSGDNLINTIRMHGKVAALAIACGLNRSVVIQIGNGNGASLHFNDPNTGQPMENMHYLSHRRVSHGSDGVLINNADLQHHYCDRALLSTFNDLVTDLRAFVMPDGNTLLDAGVACWFNDLGNGPGHSYRDLPWLLAGSCNGYFKQGEAVEAVADNSTSLNKLHNTIATAVGARKANGDVIDDFGDPSLEGGLLDTVRAT